MRFHLKARRKGIKWPDQQRAAGVAMCAIVKAGWRPVEEVKSAIERHTGVKPRDSESVNDYIARATQCSRYQVNQFLGVLDSTGSFDLADKRTFGGGPSVLRGAVHAVALGVLEFAPATRGAVLGLPGARGGPF